MTQPAENPPSDPSLTLRIGHADRDEVIEVLRDAAAEGRLTTEELTERIEATTKARFFAELDEIVADLPTPPPSDKIRPRPAQALMRPNVHTEPGQHPLDPLVLRASWENAKRTGRWSPPPFIRLEPVAATAEANFLEAVTDLEVIDVEVTAGAGTAAVVIPEDWGVNIDRLSSSWGAVKSRVPAVPAQGRPLIRVHGSVGMASFVARHAGYFERKRLEK
ncbi:hypothetical protein GCM10022261_21390 [Brevibacterium daeguense]|uniref:DUF1707 domain-containing protein n=1 Tax=Brevibacterium daeguense TaxID=909936 RepID=A0ABP8EKX5_9MICO|nr:DUF1707 domain-containing protein [Brevibacterium daeguense]